MKARNELKQRGIIEFKERGTKATAYKINTISNSKQDSKQDSKQNSKQNSVQDSAQDSSTLKDIDIDKNNTCAPEVGARNKEQDFEIIYSIYPKKRGRSKAYELYLGWLKGRSINGKKIRLTNRQMYLAVRKYVNQCEEDAMDLQYYKNFDTLMGKQILDYVEVEE